MQYGSFSLYLTERGAGARGRARRRARARACARFSVRSLLVDRVRYWCTSVCGEAEIRVVDCLWEEAPNRRQTLSEK